MRTALVSDFHANAVGLAAVLADLEADPVDQVVCLGDVAQGGAQPVEVVDRLRGLGWPVVLGNADAFLLDPESGEEPVTPRHLEVRDWSLAQLGAARLDFLRGFRPTVEAELGDGFDLLAFHGSPASYDDVILPTLAESEFRSLLGPARASVLAGGHVHLQYVRRYGVSLVVNPGSAGLSYDHEQPEDDFRFDPFACYARITTGPDRIDVAFRRVRFDPQAVVDAVLASGIPYGAETAAQWRPR